MEIKKEYLAADDTNLMPKVWAIYQESFPPTERRSLENIRTCLRGEHCRMVVYHRDDMVIGFIIYWQYPHFTYGEFFATNLSIRNSGNGSYIIRDFMSQHNDRPFILEIDGMCDEISKRRCGFYQREGFVLNPFVHRPTAYNDKNVHLTMHIMTYGHEISEQLYQEFNHVLINDIMSNIYKKPF
ncbi:MAG: GNAT family N-acetyltransferase [Rikenellaceae bacterium]